MTEDQSNNFIGCGILVTLAVAALLLIWSASAPPKHHDSVVGSPIQYGTHPLDYEHAQPRPLPRATPRGMAHGR